MSVKGDQVKVLQDWVGYAQVVQLLSATKVDLYQHYYEKTSYSVCLPQLMNAFACLVVWL